MIPNFTPQGFIKQHSLCNNPRDQDLIFSFNNNNLLLLNSGQLPQWQDLKPLLGHESGELYCFGEIQGQRCLILGRISPTVVNRGEFVWKFVRFVHESLSDSFFRIAGLACQLDHWRTRHIFCGHCGAQTLDKEDERAKICPQCQDISYPQLYPCIIVLVTRGRQLLLARSPHFQPGVYSTLAGFMEPGESAENAVFREVKEEVNINVKNIRYVLSQPWPFPNSLMLGFYAEYESGEINIDPIEIVDAQWFDPEKLPKLTSSFSVSRFLIDKHLQAQASANDPGP